MENIRVLSGKLFFLIGIFIASASFSQTGSYTCNVIYGDQIDQALFNVQVDLYNSSNEFLATTFTNETGHFTFDNLTIGESYTAKFTYDEDVNTVDLEDAFGLLQYLYGNIELTELELLAANVNGDSHINWIDFWYILIHYYVNEMEFPIGNWVLPDWTFEMTANKATGGPASIGSTGDIVGGDLPDKNGNNNLMSYQNILEFNNETLVVPIFVNDIITTKGVGIVLGFNSDLIEITEIDSEIEGLNYNIKDGIIRIGWTDFENIYSFTPENAVLNIHIKEKKDQANGQIEHFELLEGTHILDKSGTKYPYLDFTSSEFKLSNQQTISTINETAYPNPCKDYFIVNLIDEEFGTASIEIYNSLGQIIISENLSIHNNKLIITTQNIDNGLYFYQINTQSKLIKGTINISN